MAYLQLFYLFMSIYLVIAIWFIQLVQYPKFLKIADVDFQQFHKRHSEIILIFVMPAMISEVVLGLLLFYFEKNNWELKLLIQAFFVALIWLSTFFIYVPIHEVLEKIKDVEKINKLIKLNWLRTILWTLKLILVLWK